MIYITIKESLSRIISLKPIEVRQKEWNDAVRKGLIAGADWLINVNLRQRKFRPGNRSRYGFAARSVKYMNYKRFARLVRDPFTGLKVQPAKPSVDLVYTGWLRDFIEARDPSLYRKIPTATSNRVRLRVPIQTPQGHRMQAQQYLELGLFTEEEYVEVRRIVVAVVAKEMGFGDATEVQLWRRAA